MPFSDWQTLYQRLYGHLNKQARWIQLLEYLDKLSLLNTHQGQSILSTSIMCEFAHFITQNGATWWISYHSISLDNAILKLKHNGLLILTLTCAASSDLNPVYYAVWGALQEMVYYCRSFKFMQELNSAILSQRSNKTVTSDSWPKYRWIAASLDNVG